MLMSLPGMGKMGGTSCEGGVCRVLLWMRSEMPVDSPSGDIK